MDSPNVGWDVDHEYWYPPNGGDPTCTGGICPILGKNNAAPKADAGEFKAVNVSHSRPTATPRMSIWGRIKQWWNCTKGACYWGSQTCGGFVCRVRVCVGGAIGCLSQ
jgi:hypothetical protein